MPVLHTRSTYSTQIDDSAYHSTTCRHIDISSLHPFWASVYVHIPLQDRKSKVGHRRAYQEHFVGYKLTSTVSDNIIILEVLDTGHCKNIRNSKDIIFDTFFNFLHPDPDKFPSDEDFFMWTLNPYPIQLRLISLTHLTLFGHSRIDSRSTASYHLWVLSYTTARHGYSVRSPWCSLLVQRFRWHTWILLHYDWNQSRYLLYHHQGTRRS